MRFLFNLALPTFPGRCQPSILSVVDFTSVFGMGTGVSPQLYAPEIFQNFLVIFDLYVLMNVNDNEQPKFFKIMVKTFGLLVLVSSTHYYAYTPSLSTS